MAKPRNTPEPDYSSLVASAVRLPIVKRNQIASKTQGWQKEASRLYDVLGELRFVANWVGQVMSRATLVPIKATDPPTEQTSGPAKSALDDYFKGHQGQAEMQRLTGVHITVTGECYHVYRADLDKWFVLAYDKVKQDGEKVMCDFGDGDGWVEITTGTDMAIRVWTPHPMNPEDADSPVRSNLSTLLEIERCNLHIQATLTSRLAGAGLLLLPDEITFPKPEDADPAATNADVFMETLGEAMTTPIQDPGNAAAVVPLVVMAPGEYLSAPRHMTFWSEMSESILATRDAAIKRFALGMDVPPEVLTGMADTNHWNAWLVDEASIKAHTEPRLSVIANAITTAYLWPALDGQVPDPEQYGVVADTAQIRLRPNRSSEAIELWDRDELSGAALRRETGFDEADAPTSEERKRSLLRRIAQAASSPEQASAAAKVLGLDLPVAGESQEQPDNLGTPARREDPESRREPDTERSAERAEQQVASGALVAACDALVYRALERAGNRLKSAHRYNGKVPAYEVYMHLDTNPRQLDLLFADCWGPVPKIIGEHTNNVEQVTLALDTYVKFLVREQVPHSTDALREALALARL